MIVHVNSPELYAHILEFEHRRADGEPVRMYLAEGDSWFSLGGFGNGNLLGALDTMSTLIVDCAAPGDTLRKIADCGNDVFRLMLRPHYGAHWDGVLLSAGGNDLLGDVGALIEYGEPSHGNIAAALEGILRGYMRIVAAIRAHQDCPIHAHTYDYPAPDTWGGWFRAGPWIANRLLDHGIAAHRHASIVTDLVDALAETIYSAAAKTGMVVYDTRGTLEARVWRRFGGQADWRNELHPTRAGYARLAARWAL